MYGSQMYGTQPTYQPQSILGGLAGGQFGKWLGGQFGQPELGGLIGGAAGSFLPLPLQAGPQAYAPQGVAPQAAGAVSPQFWSEIGKFVAEEAIKQALPAIQKEVTSWFSAGPGLPQQAYAAAPQAYGPAAPQAAGAVSPQWGLPGWAKKAAKDLAKQAVEIAIDQAL